MTDITKQTVVEVNILFAQYLLSRMPIVMARTNYDSGRVVESSGPPGKHGNEWFALVEDVRQIEIIIEKLTDEFVTQFFVIKRRIRKKHNEVEIKEEKVLGPIFLQVSQDNDKIRLDRPHTLNIDITVFEGDEKEKYEDLYNQIVEYATTYIGLYNQYVPDWITLSVTRHINLKMKTKE